MNARRPAYQKQSYALIARLLRSNVRRALRLNSPAGRFGVISPRVGHAGGSRADADSGTVHTGDLVPGRGESLERQPDQNGSPAVPFNLGPCTPKVPCGKRGAVFNDLHPQAIPEALFECCTYFLLFCCFGQLHYDLQPHRPVNKTEFGTRCHRNVPGLHQHRSSSTL